MRRVAPRYMKWTQINTGTSTSLSTSFHRYSSAFIRVHYQRSNAGDNSVDELNQDQKVRRAILKLAVAASGLLILDGVRRFLGFQEPRIKPVRAVLEKPELYAPGSIVTVPEVGCWLLRDADGFYAITRVCPHLGCQVRKEEATFTCPCHGSAFSTDGAVVNGPADRPLRQVQVGQSSDHRLVVDASVTVPAGTRLQL
jgi:nitrite reductase/ring-hydroxylating ferredoxin subunit